jgi:hypothetical protein
MKTVLLNISESNNDWNMAVLDMSWRERDATHGFPPPKRVVEATQPVATSQASPNAKHPSGQ